MISRVAGTRSQSDRERVDAARALLARPLLTAEHPDELALVRLHGPALRGMFKSILGYQLIVESTFARLTKGPISADGPSRPARRADGATFTPLIYTRLALLCAALLAPGTGEQVLISALIDQVRSDAAAIGLAIGDTLPERRALVNAIGQLVEWGVLTETDGTASGWSEHHDEALLTINRAILPHLLAKPLSDVGHFDALLAADPHAADQPRRSLRCKLVENPVVRREDLSDAERDVLSRERSEITRVLIENFGLTLEVRAEGALAYDAAGNLTDITFPGNGRVKQAALLLLAELIDLKEPVAGAVAPLDDGRVVTGFAVTSAEVEAAIGAIIGRHGRAWGAAAAEEPDRLRTDVAAVLADLGLATAANGGLVIHPAAARYRPLPEAAPPTRASRRHAAQTDREWT